MRRGATRIVTSTLGVYAGLLGATHGYFEILQGIVTPSGIMINAIGSPCRADAVWHACFPAMTILPNLLAAGILTVVVGLIVLIWATGFVEKNNGGWILILLSLLMLLVGGGFIPALVGIIAGAAGVKIDAPFHGLRAHLSVNLRRFLVKLWPWTLVAFVVWSLGGWVLGYFFNQTMMSLSLIPFFLLDLGLPLLAAFTGFAYDLSSSDRKVAL